MAVPKKIDPCPIIETVTEIRFQPNVPGEAVFGIIYEKIKTKTHELIKLPVLQIPENIREREPQFKFQAHYRLEFENFQAQIGPRVISVIVLEPYPGWASYSKEVYDFFDIIKESQTIGQEERLGLRYINFFEKTNVFEKLKLSITLDQKQFLYEDIFLNTVKTKDELKSDLKIQNSTTISQQKQKKEGGSEKVERVGSIIDIDIAVEKTKFLENFKKLLESAHEFEKEIFFGLLKEDFLKTFNPEY